jgi:hypothetical protein
MMPATGTRLAGQSEKSADADVTSQFIYNSILLQVKMNSMVAAEQP